MPRAGWIAPPMYRGLVWEKPSKRRITRSGPSVAYCAITPPSMGGQSVDSGQNDRHEVVPSGPSPSYTQRIALNRERNRLGTDMALPFLNSSPRKGKDQMVSIDLGG